MKSMFILGCTEYDGLRCELYQDTDMFLICFDIANTESFQNVTENVSWKNNGTV